MTRFLIYKRVLNSGNRQQIILQIPQIAEMYDCGETTLIIMTNGREHTVPTKLTCLMNEIAIGESILSLVKETK